jgi:hypothetical protein
MKNHRSSHSGDRLGRNPIKGGKDESLPLCHAAAAFPALTKEATVSATVFGILSSLPGIGG